MPEGRQEGSNKLEAFLLCATLLNIHLLDKNVRHEHVSGRVCDDERESGRHDCSLNKSQEETSGRRMNMP